MNIPAEQEQVPPIDRWDFVLVRLPFVSPFGTSVQTWTQKEALLLRCSSQGVVAWGECVADPDPFYAYETTATARHIIREFLLPLVEPGVGMAELMRRFGHVRGHGMAKAAVENALLSLIALRKGVPLHALLGFPPRKIMSGISIGLKETVGDLLRAVEAAAEEKYHRVKMKISPGKDVAWVRAVRERFPDLPLMVDANGAYTPGDGERLSQLDEFHLTMIEQPLSYSDIYEHSLLQARLKTPLCLDESLLSLADVSAALALKACGVINIKQGRVGGLLESLRIADCAAGQGIGAWSGGMDETGIGRAVNMHLQADPSFTLPGDTSATSNYFSEDIADPPVVLDARGYIAIPEGAGLGITVDPGRLQKYTIGWEHLRL